jgi:hypothetical protein
MIFSLSSPKGGEGWGEEALYSPLQILYLWQKGNGASVEPRPTQAFNDFYIAWVPVGSIRLRAI